MNTHILLKRLFLLFVLTPLISATQVADDFSDGEILHDPSWTGDVNRFIVNNSYQLQLNDEGEGKASLFTPVYVSEEQEWRCWVRQSFSPSANNHSRIYLAAEYPDTSGLANGIYLQLGESGSQDAICLMKQEKGDTTTLIRAKGGMISTSFKCRIKVLLDVDGWRLFVDYSGGKDFIPEGHYPLHPVSGSSYLGIYCKYTTSNSKKFYFDDFYSGPALNDTIVVSNRYDILINEVMADPSPPAGLPEHEYLELFNTGPEPVDMYDWMLIIGGSEKSLTGAKIIPYGYLIIAHEDAMAELEMFGDFWGLESFSLSNAGQEIMLLNHRGELIDHIYYHDHWYSDPDKDDGGFSLELKNPQNPCLGKENWGVSEHFKGGTPGTINSIYDEFYFPPAVSRSCVPDANRIQIIFNQSMHFGLSLRPEIFSINDEAGTIQAVLPADPWLTSFVLYPENPLVQGWVYELFCNEYIYNCYGDSVMLTETFYVGIPHEPGWNDLIINEVLFDPYPGGCDFIEIYNASEGIVSLAGLKFGFVKSIFPSPADTSFLTIREACLDLMPGQYLVMCKNIDGIVDFYHCPDHRKIISSEEFPSLIKEGGRVLIISPSGILLDAFSYCESMHYPLLNTSKGVSLERISYDGLSQDVNNWHSASFQAGFATPGYENSQHSERDEGEDPIFISPRVFTPGYDGVNDYISVYYNFSSPGMLANITIFTPSGYAVRRLVNNELLGTSGKIAWDGLNDDHGKANAGVYIILAELTDLNGSVRRYKQTAVIAP